jgi:hypothetical protein
MMMRRTSVGLAALLIAATVGCGGRMVMVPPRIDLTQHQMLGVIEFTSSSKGKLGPLATRRFTEASRRDQGLVRMVGLGTEKEILRSTGRARLDAEAYQAIGREHDVRTILVGSLDISKVKPNISLAGLRSGSLSALVDATLTVQMVEVSTGATLWNRSARATQSVANVSVLAGSQFSFDAADPDAAYGALVDSLVEQVTSEFHSSWVRQ